MSHRRARRESPACPSSRTGSELLRVMSPGRFGVVLAGLLFCSLARTGGSRRSPVGGPTHPSFGGFGLGQIDFAPALCQHGCQRRLPNPCPGGQHHAPGGACFTHIHGSSSGTQGHDTAIPVPHGRGSTQSASRMKRQGPEGPAGPGMAPTSLSRTNLSSRYAPELRGQPSEKTLREAHPRDEIPKGQTDVMTSIDTFPTQPSGSTSPS